MKETNRGGAKTRRWLCCPSPCRRWFLLAPLGCHGDRISPHNPRSLVQIQPPQPRRDKGLAVAAANPFDVSAPVLRPLHRVTEDVRRAAAVLAEYQAIELPRFRCVGIRHQMPVAVGRRLDRGVSELCLDVFRVGPVSDQKARVRVAQIMDPGCDAAQRRRSIRAQTR